VRGMQLLRVFVLTGLTILASACGEGERPRGRVLMIGVDGATLRIAEPLMQAGKLPNLKRMADEGVSGPLRSFMPLFSPRIWNTIVTGKTPEHHGIGSFTYHDAEGREQLFLSHHRKVHALWNIVSDAGLTVGVVNWWNTYPPELINGVMVSDHAKPNRTGELRKLTGAETEDPSGDTVFPPQWEARVAEIYSKRSQITQIDDPFLGNVGMARWMGKEGLSRRYYEDTQATQIGLEIEKVAAPEVLLVFVPGTDRISHRIWAVAEPDDLYPPQRQLREREREAGLFALHTYYQFFDELIGLLSASFGPDDLVVVLSDHGFEAGMSMGFLTGKHETEKAQDGILFMRGPGIPAGGSTKGTTINDITPTILAWLGLPVGRDMDGQPASFLEVDDFPTVATYDTKPVERLGAAASGREEEIIEHLRSLGYLE